MTGRLVLLLVLLASGAAGCGSEEPAAGPASSTPTTAPETLPPAVATKKEAIVSAAKALDYDRFESLLDRKTFSYSFGESGDPVGYWRRLEDEGEVPILGDYLPVVFSAPYARKGDTYVWPTAYAKSPSSWTAEDRRWLMNFYTEAEIRGFERAGAYLGWRAGIREDGKWLFFVAGD
ncbi:MAG: hypothetical protein AABM30_06460 [Actinomycetota bacterium]